MPNKTCYCCGGLVIPKDGREPPLTGLGRVQCWWCFDGSSERVEPPGQRYESGARCRDCLTKLPPERRCGRCEPCQEYRRREIRRGYMRAYRRKQTSKALRAAG